MYEAQTLAHFITWLADGAALAGGWSKPTEDWIGQALFGDATNGNPFVLVATAASAINLRTPAAGEFPITVMAYGFGRSDGVISGARLQKSRGQKNLALAFDEINGRKGNWFSGKTPDYFTGVNSEDTRSKVAQRMRSAAGVFSYLNYIPTDGSEAVWNKWMRVSNWIDLVCHVFDQDYAAGTIPGEPVNPNGGGAMRSLYAKFIDAHLSAIEALAAGFSTSAAQDYATYFSQDAWYNNAFVGNGFITANSMRFRRVAAGAGGSAFGAYANGAMTIDGSNNIVNNIGAPAAIP